MACCLAAVPLCAAGVCAIGCANWLARRCMLHGSLASDDWPDASSEDFKDVDRICKVILAVYEEDIAEPVYADHLVKEDVVKRVTYKDAGGKCPPYIIYLDHEAKDIVLALRGLHLAKKGDYVVLWNNRKGQQMFDGGYVHHGLLQVAGWLLDKEFDTLKELVQKYPDYTLTLGGHSLGSGVAALMTILIVNNLQELGNITRDRIKCYCVAPARCTSMNLAIRYADCINSVVLQDDFLPRTTVPLQIIFGAALCLPCLLSFTCVKETCTSADKKLKDPRRLYAPGRLYHVVYTKYLSCKKYPPEVRTSIPVNGRFEHLVCSMNATEDHSLVELEKKAAEAYQLMLKIEEEAAAMEPPTGATMTRSDSRSVSYRRNHPGEHQVALQQAVSLGVHNADEPSVTSATIKEENEEGNVTDVQDAPQTTPPQEGDALITIHPEGREAAGGAAVGEEPSSARIEHDRERSKTGLGMDSVDLRHGDVEKGSIYGGGITGRLVVNVGESEGGAVEGKEGNDGGGGGASGFGIGGIFKRLHSSSSGKTASRQGSGVSSTGGGIAVAESFQERRQRAEAQRKEEERLILEEQRRAAEAGRAVSALSKWDQAIEALISKHHGKHRHVQVDTPVTTSRERWSKVRETIRPHIVKARMAPGDSDSTLPSAS